MYTAAAKAHNQTAKRRVRGCFKKQRSHIGQTCPAGFGLQGTSCLPSSTASATAQSLRYFQQDSLGSTSVITDQAGTFLGAVAGGVDSVIGGGKFSNGATTAAYGYLFNGLSQYKGSTDDRLRMGGYEVKDYIRYEQESGRLYLIDGLCGSEYYLGTGYAGSPEGLNNPSMQGRADIGPIPEGLYRIEAMQNNRTGSGTMLADSMRLTPLTPLAGGRSGFLIHSDYNNWRSSQGCICTPLNVRQAISNTGVNRLQVVGRAQ